MESHAQKLRTRATNLAGRWAGRFIRNKAFFFVDYQGLLLQTRHQLYPHRANGPDEAGHLPEEPVPESDLRSRHETAVPNGHYPQGDAWQIPAARFDPVSAKMVAGATIWPTATNQSSTSNNFNANTIEPDNSHQFDIKGDYQFANGDRSSCANPTSAAI